MFLFWQICFLLSAVFAEGKPYGSEVNNKHGESEVRFSNFYQDRMVLQRAPESATVWGYGVLPAKSKAIMNCSDGQNELWSTTSIPFQDSDEMWKLELEPQVGGSVCSIEIGLGDEDQISLQNVLFGDVFLCSGQSNMEFAMHSIYNGSEEIEKSQAYTDLRFVRVENSVAEDFDDAMDIELHDPWSDPSYFDLKHFSAVCFLFGRNIYDQIKIPVGVIQTAWGGTHVESWSSPEMLQECGVEEEDPMCVREKDGRNCNSLPYNKMLYPLRKTTLKGFLWYQGEANTNWNTDKYNCTFPTKIEGDRSLFSSNSNTNKNAPYGFVQLSTAKDPESEDLKTSIIRWHQTSDHGYVPNERQDNVFMAVAIDTYDPGHPGVHPRYKQIVSERLSIAAMNMVYGKDEFPTNGPMVNNIELLEGPILSLTYDQQVSYNNEEISGFYYCCTDYDRCDEQEEGKHPKANWLELDKQLVTFKTTKDSSSIDINIGELIVCEIEVPHIAYLWRETPVEKYIGAPIYATNQYHLPSAPWKMSAIEYGIRSI